MDLPARAHLEHLVEARGLADAQHPLLRLGDHDLEGRHVGLAQRHPGDVEVDADAALGRHLRRARRQPRRAEVLQRDEQAAVEQLQRALQELLLLEGVADLDGRALVGVVGAELGAGQDRRAADAVATRRRPEQHDDVADARGRGPGEAPARREAERHRVDEAVRLVGRLEVHLAADRRHADRVPVVADAHDGVVEQVARARAGGLAEAQRVEDGDRPRPEGEDVAQDAADARGRALEGLHGAGVVVRLDLEGADQAAADVDRARVLPRAEHDRLALGRQRAQELLGVLVGAVLAPHEREHRELDLVRGTAELGDDEVVLVARQAEGDRVLRRRQRVHLRRGHASAPRPPSRRRAPARRRSRRPARRRRARGGASGRGRCVRRCRRPRWTATSR